MSVHAPAPWSIDSAGILRDGNDQPIALLWDGERKAANGALLLAAPAMLALLIEVRADPVHRLRWCDRDEDRQRLREIDALIARVTGRTEEAIDA